MTYIYQIQTSWAREAQKAAIRQLRTARLLVDRSGAVRMNWYERLMRNLKSKIA